MALLPDALAAQIMADPRYRASAADARAYGRCVAVAGGWVEGASTCGGLGVPLRGDCAEAVAERLAPAGLDPEGAEALVRALPQWSLAPMAPELGHAWTRGAQGDGARVIGAVQAAGLPYEVALAGARSAMAWTPQDGALALASVLAAWPEPAQAALVEEAGARAGRVAGAQLVRWVEGLDSAHRAPFVRGFARGGAEGVIAQASPAAGVLPTARRLRALLARVSAELPGEGRELRWGVTRAVVGAGLGRAATDSLLAATGLQELGRQVRESTPLPVWMGADEVATHGSAMVPRMEPTILR